MSGLALAVDGGTVSVPAGATTQTLAPAPSSGAHYVVGIATQPAGETCAVINGSGTIGNANVTNVAVTCLANTYRVFGTITGLTADGLVLLDNGSDASTIQVSATHFTMPTAVAYGSVYDVTVQSEPTGLVCSVSDGTGPVARLLQGSDGNFYGLTNTGGTSGGGTIFEVTPAGVETVLHRFSAGDGQNPQGGLVEDTTGDFFGATVNGGSSGFGTVFKLAANGTETVLHSFTKYGDGGSPGSPLIQGTDGNFYGTTSGGGANGDGTVFKVTSSSTETVVYSFAGGSADGSDPAAGLLQASDGNFHGTTKQGGSSGDGTVFRITPAGVETIVGLCQPGPEPSRNQRPSGAFGSGFATNGKPDRAKCRRRF